MMAFLAACLLASLLAMGSGLQCEVCAAVEEDCSGSLQPCPARQDSCGIFLTEVTLDGGKFLSIVKGCVTPSQCTAGPTSVYLGNARVRMGTACCTGDACRTVNVTLPPPDTEPNGQRCPACYSAPTGQCSEETISCTGSETQCIESAGTINMGERSLEFTLKGCASASACDQFQMGSGTFLGPNVTLTTAECTVASGGTNVPLSTPPTRPASRTLGSGLQCEVCAAVEEDCSGSLQPCPAGQDSCGIILTEVTLDGVKFLSIMKGCVTPSQCTAGPTSVYLGNARVRMGTACCTGDACRTVNVTLPPPDTEPNGRRCPACFSAPTGQCREETVNCTGSETQCLESAGTINMGERSLEFTLKGCASETDCAQFQMGSGTFLGPNVTLTTAECTVASGGTNVPLSTPPTRPASRTLGSGLQCEVCATVEENCSGSLQPCPAGQDSCGIILTEVTLDGVKILSIVKGCVTPSQCTAGPTSVYLGNARVRMGTACCTGDACRTVNVTLPPPDTEPNGRRCPACFSAPTGQCREETVNCTGSESQCIESAGTINMGERSLEFTLKGCASASACDQFQMGSGTFLGPNVTLTMAECTAASSGTNVPLSTPPTRPASRTLGAGLQCEVCSAVEENCSGSLQPCPAGQDSCGIFLTEVTLDGGKFLSIVKGCVTPSQCTAGPTSVYFGIARVRMGTACCTGDACRTVNVTLPPHDTEPNGRRCPACYSASTQCSEETVNCTGSESQCIESAGTINMGERPFEFTLKGCASASACDQFQMGSGTFLVPYLTLTTAKCTAASSGTNVPLSTPPPSPASTTSRGAGVALGPARLLPALAGLLLWLLS